MKKVLILIPMLLISLVLVSGCVDESDENENEFYFNYSKYCPYGLVVYIDEFNEEELYKKMDEFETKNDTNRYILTMIEEKIEEIRIWHDNYSYYTIGYKPLHWYAKYECI